MAQPITPELLAILQSKLQAGAKGHRALVEIGNAAPTLPTAGNWEDWSPRVTVSPDIGLTSGGCLLWQQRMNRYASDLTSNPLRYVTGSELFYLCSGMGTDITNDTNNNLNLYVLADDQFWSSYVFDVRTSVFISGTLPSGSGGHNFKLGFQLGDLVGLANGQLYDGNMATMHIDGTGAGWSITVGNRLVDHVQPLDFDPMNQLVNIRWQHNGTVSRAKAWVGAEPAWGDPDTVSRSDVADDAITGNMFAICISDLGATAGEDISIQMLSIIDGSTYYGCVGPVLEYVTYQPSVIEVEKSFSADADSASVEIPNPSNAIEPIVTTPIIDIERRIRIWQWYGDIANKVRSFEGLIDEVAGHRHPNTITIRTKDRMKLLINESVIPTDPQGATDVGAVRTPANFVWLNANAVDIINGLLDKAGWPTALRSITDTNQIVAEFVAALNDSFSGALRRVCNIVVYEMSVDEEGIFQCHPRPSALTGDAGGDTLPAPVASFSGAREVYVIDAGIDDNDLKTRVSVFGAAAVAPTETWNEIWNSNIVAQPNGIYDRTTGELYVIDGKKRLIYLMVTGEDKPIAKSLITPSAISTHSCDGGMDGFPGIAYEAVVLETPYRDGVDGLGSSSANCRLLVVNLSTGAVLAAHAVLGAGTYTAVRTTGSHIYVTRFDNQTIKKFDTSFALVDTIDISSIGAPTGLAIDGSDLWIFAGGTISVVAESAPTTVITTHPAPGAVGGGEIDSSDNSYLYADVPGAGLIYKYQLVIPGTPAISADAIDYALEDALGARAGVEPRTHTGCPYIVGDHPFERRLFTLSDETLTSTTQAQDTANRLLARLSKKRRIVQIGIIAQPQLQKGDPIEVHDPPSGLDHQLMMIDTYQTSQREGTYLGTISGPLWIADY